MGTAVVDMENYWKEEEDDSTTALKTRPPRAPLSSSSSEALPVKDDGGEQEQQPQEEENQAPPATPPLQEEEQKQPQAGRSIYLDTLDGTKSANGFGGINVSVDGHSVEEKKLENGEPDLTLNGVDVPNGPTTEADCGSKQNLKDAGQSSSTFTYSEKSSENGFTKDTHLSILTEGKQDIKEWDVETVIAEQETHDLYCPNCKSCITKRVILRKRKRQPSRQNVVDQLPSLVDSDEDHDTAPPNTDVSPLADTSDQDQIREPDLFRCLSCFSFFIPSVACFKSFFGYRGERESEQTGAVNQGGTATEQAEVVTGELESQYPPKLQSDEISPVLPLASKSPKESANDLGLVPHKRKDMVVSSSSVMLDIVKNDVAPHGTDIKNREEKKDVAASAASASTSSQPGYSHVDEHFNMSTTKTWNYDQHGQVSSKSVSIHQENTRSTDDNQTNSSQRTEEGFSAMQDLSTCELPKPSAHLDKNLPVENNGSLNSPGFRYPRISDKNLEEHMSIFEPLLPQDRHVLIGKDLEGLPRSTDAGKEVRVQIEEERFRSNVSENSKNNINSLTTDTSTYTVTEYRGEQPVGEDTSSSKWDILKSVVYGGLVESITSLGVVSSAAGGGAATLNIIAIGLASLVGGLFMIAHGLVDLKNEQYGRDTTQYRSVDRYQELLGNRRSFKLHATLAILSYLLFGLVAPVTYCFSFQESDNRDYKLIAVAVASLVCIAILAFSKVYAQQPPKAYFTTVMYYVSMGVMSSGLSYVVGVLVKKLLEDLGWFESTVVPPPPAGFHEQMAGGYLSSSY